MATFIVINRHRVRANRQRPPEQREPVIRVSEGRHGKPDYWNDYKLADDVWLRYKPDEPLPCGATVYIESNRWPE